MAWGSFCFFKLLTRSLWRLFNLASKFVKICDFMNFEKNEKLSILNRKIRPKPRDLPKKLKNQVCRTRPGDHFAFLKLWSRCLGRLLNLVAKFVKIRDFMKFEKNEKLGILNRKIRPKPRVLPKKWKKQVFRTRPEDHFAF